MSFERIRKDGVSGGIVFWVMEGNVLAVPFTASHSLAAATTVIVEREDTPRGTKKPARIRGYSCFVR